jgi:ABC-type iron transport system FetAB permease component
VVPVSAFVVMRYVPRGFERGRDIDFIRRLVVGDSLGLALFAVLVAAAVYFRRKPDIHKRLMIVSCFTIYGPVFARYDLVYGIRLPEPTLLFLPLCVLTVYDLIQRRRPHQATMWAALLLVITWGPGYFLLISSRVPDMFITAMR